MQVQWTGKTPRKDRHAQKKSNPDTKKDNRSLPPTRPRPQVQCLFPQLTLKLLLFVSQVCLIAVLINYNAYMSLLL
jgi:hypothetical protein